MKLIIGIITLRILFAIRVICVSPFSRGKSCNVTLRLLKYVIKQSKVNLLAPKRSNIANNVSNMIIT